MFNGRRNKRGNANLEYALTAAVVIAALLGMSVYIFRGVCGKWRLSADSLGFGRQYDPQATTITRSEQ